MVWQGRSEGVCAGEHGLAFTRARGFDPRTGQSHHYAFHVSEAEFEAIFSRVTAKGIPYGSEPHSHTDGRTNTRRGGRGFYFEDPYEHLLEVMTVPETGS
ncbi:MAG: VOC family protein [Candidatus Rokuibacteriota bacterium]